MPMVKPLMSIDKNDAFSHLAEAMAAAGDVAYEWDIASDRMVWGGPLETLGLGDPSALATGRALAGRINPADLPSRQHRLNRHYHAGEAFECEYRLRAEDGSFVWVQDRGRAVLDDSGSPVRMLGILRGQNGRKAQEARLEQLANFDELTGHFNKTRLREAVQHVLAYNRRVGIAGAYLVVGIDNMSMVNDAFGTEAADAVIVEVGQRLDRCLGLGDVIGRLGGDRFGILLGNCSDEGVAPAAERILAAVGRAPIFTAAGPIYVTASVGSVTFPAQAEAPQDVMTRAETALAQAKRAGRDCHTRYGLNEEHRTAHRASMELGERVQRALKHDRLPFAFQPIIECEDGSVDYYECLLRLREESGAILSAAEFIPAVEQLGFIRTIDRHVLEKAVEELATHPDISLGFNISGLTAADKPWFAAITGLLRGRPDLAQRLVVEITETVALSDFEESARFVRALRDLGCRVALDDFGAGFTSLRHLQGLAVDTVKIDGSFVRNLAASYDNQVFLRHLLGLANGLGLRTVAECVETAQEAAILRREGVGYLQGYYFGKPSIARPWVAEQPVPLLSSAAS